MLALCKERACMTKTTLPVWPESLCAPIYLSIKWKWPCLPEKEHREWGMKKELEKGWRPGKWRESCLTTVPLLWLASSCLSEVPQTIRKHLLPEIHLYLYPLRTAQLSVEHTIRQTKTELFSSPKMGFCQLSTKENAAWEAKSLWPCAAPVWSSVLRLKPNLPQTVLAYQRTVKLKGSGASGRSRLDGGS